MLDEFYYIGRGHESLLIQEDGGIAWSRYMMDATQFDTEEEAEATRLKYGLIMCGVGWRSSRKFHQNPYLPPREQRITPGVIGHPTGGKIWDLYDHLLEFAEQWEKEKTENPT